MGLTPDMRPRQQRSPAKSRWTDTIYSPGILPNGDKRSVCDCLLIVERGSEQENGGDNEKTEDGIQ